MKKKYCAVLIAALMGSLAFNPAAALAQEVTVNGAPCTLDVYATPNTTTLPQEMELDAFTILGRYGSGLMLIRAEDQE